MTAVSGHEEPLDVEDALDPLSHLSSIFDKIRKQVIEWGEDANWKIDVFLLPNEDQANGQSTPISTPKLPPSQPSNQPPLPHHPQAPLVDHGNRQRIPGPYPVRELSPPPAMDRGNLVPTMHLIGLASCAEMRIKLSSQTGHPNGSTFFFFFSKNELGARRYPVPPPHMPPSSLDERRLLNLQEPDIVSMTMMQAKRAVCVLAKFMKYSEAILLYLR